MIVRLGGAICVAAITFACSSYSASSNGIEKEITRRPVTDVLSLRMIRVVGDLVADWKYLDERIEKVTDEIEALARADEGCQQLITVPGIGPIISSAMVAAIGSGVAFAKGRDFAAWLGLVPKQMSTPIGLPRWTYSWSQQSLFGCCTDC